MDTNNLQTVYDILDKLSPASLTYDEWLSVGMILKDEGISMDVWDSWSRSDQRYRGTKEIATKWNSFRGDGNRRGIGSLVHIAQQYGAMPHAKDTSYELDWDDEISRDDDDSFRVVDKNWIQSVEVVEPGNDWDPVKDLITYLSTLFSSEDNVGYVTESWQKDDKFLPQKGVWDRTAGQLINALNNCNGDIGSVFGDYKPEVGAWIRFNPLDGKGCRDDNVTDFRYALIESDNLPIDDQYAVIKELELPVACLVHSGNKSLHAIVRVDATNYEEYRNRVDFLYDVCKKNGLQNDKQNRNPSRLSRMPGVVRGNKKQFLVATNIGKSNWSEWREWIEGVNDDLPDPESLASIFDNLPPLAPTLIDGVLRQGHKMLIAGPSKAGKSFALIELCIAIAEGGKWMGWQCAQGQVLYVNLELDRASCFHRFSDLYKAMGLEPRHIANIDIWNLRGKAVPMDKLAPKLIRRALRKKYIAVIIDPIYKVITGDENSADQMANFCNQFDKICTELNSAVIYCHHHSKGYQGTKRSMDRASGSGVFARDPDALLDIIELHVNEYMQTKQINDALTALYYEFLPFDFDIDKLPDYVKYNAKSLYKEVEKHCNDRQMIDLKERSEKLTLDMKRTSAWRIEGTLREFPKFDPVNVWFDYPLHRLDTTGTLQDLEPLTDMVVTREKAKKDSAVKKAEKKVQEKVEKEMDIINAVELCKDEDGVCTKEALMDYYSKSERTIKEWIKNHPKLSLKQGRVIIEDESEEKQQKITEKT